METATTIQKVACDRKAPPSAVTACSSVPTNYPKSSHIFTVFLLKTPKRSIGRNDRFSEEAPKSDRGSEFCCRQRRLGCDSGPRFPSKSQADPEVGSPFPESSHQLQLAFPK